MSDAETPMRDSVAADEKTLINLHKRAIRALQDYNRLSAQWEATMGNALRMEDVMACEKNPQKELTFSKVVIERGLVSKRYSPALRWLWECRVKKQALATLAGCLCFLSGFVVWSESTFFSVHPPLSMAALFVHLAALSQNYLFIEMFSITIIMYLCICAYYTVFRMKIYRFYHLDSHHHTDENSLLFSAILFCRLTPPMCLNFLGLIHLDAHVTKDLRLETETAYTSLMGHLDVIETLAGSFNVYFPIAIIMLCICTYFRLGSRLLHFIGFEQFMENDEITADFVVSGRALALAERNQSEREMNRESRDRFWRNKLADRYARSQPESPGGGSSSIEGATDIVFDDRRGIVSQEETVLRTGTNPADNWRQTYGSPHTPPAGIFDDL